MNKENLKELAESRLIEAKILLDNKCYSGCNYLLGYVIEMALKARICTLLNDEFPESISSYKIHDFKNLIHLSGLRVEFETKCINDDEFRASYNEIFKLKVENRYILLNISGTEILSMYNSVVLIFNWIKEKW
ncbi:MAG: HEPN domain-containing protein [Cytophagales bacterium]|nr:MAG: HEPN domain-containing protein [Cytophagales bacterium]